MEKTRVPRGQRYFYIASENDYYINWVVEYRYDNRYPVDDDYFNSGNYFPTEKAAWNMIDNLVALLDGAELKEE